MKWIIILIVFIVRAAFIVPGLFNDLKIQHYSVNAVNISNSIRIALVTDLHSCRYGEKEQELIEAIDEQKPDIIMMAGDIFDNVIPDDNTEYFLQGVVEKYPCYYVTGNHEYWSGSSAFSEKMAVLEKYGVKRLSGEFEAVTVNGETINVCGVDDPDAYMVASKSAYQNDLSFDEQLIRVNELSDNGNYTILISHRPELFKNYTKYDFDLVLCGHAHGGQWRIPGILNGLYAPNQGLFPKYAGGEYNDGRTKMIVSRGLARENTRVPRIYDRPELVIVDLN